MTPKMYICVFPVTCNFERGKVGRKILFLIKKFLHGHDGDDRETKSLNGIIPWNLNQSRTNGPINAPLTIAQV